MANIGDTLPYGIKIAPIQGGIARAVTKIQIATSQGAVDKVVTGIKIAPVQGAINKRIYIGGGKLGDIDNNGTVTISDYTIVRLYNLGQKTLTQEEFFRADVNQDGVVNSIDEDMIKAYILGG